MPVGKKYKKFNKDKHKTKLLLSTKAHDDIRKRSKDLFDD